MRIRRCETTYSYLAPSRRLFLSSLRCSCSPQLRDTVQPKLSPDGPQQAVVTVDMGESVEWAVALGASATLTDAVHATINPQVRPLSQRDLLGWDGGMLSPQRTYRRQFATPGVYAYEDGLGHVGQVAVDGE